MAHGSILRRFQLIETIARSHFGRVLRIADRESGEHRALKIAHVGAGEAMVLDEFAQLARLRHPALPRVFEVGRTEEPIDDVPLGTPFFIAEWIAGARADAREWTHPETLWVLLADVSSALAAIHEAGLVHGDVAPQNVLVRDQGAVLVDLGLASAHGARGTPAYMAPESLAGHVEPRSDLYGLGVTVVRLALGRDPFSAPTLGELVHRITTTAAPMLPETVFGPLTDLVARLCARDIDVRPASALAVVEELEKLRPALAPSRPRPDRCRMRPPPAPIAWPGARPWIDELVRGLGRGGVHVVVGDAGSGAQDLVAAATLKWQLERATVGDASIPTISGSLEDVARQLESSGLAPRSDEPMAHWVGRIAAALWTCDALVVLELAQDPRCDTVIAALARSDLQRPVIAMVEADPTVEHGAATHFVPALDLVATAALATTVLGKQPPQRWSAALHAASGGRAATAVELARAAGAEPDPFSVTWDSLSTTGFVELRGRQLRGVTLPAQRLAHVAAAWGGRVRTDYALATARAVEAAVPQRSGDTRQGPAPGLAEVIELERAGLARRRSGELIIDAATAAAAVAAGPDSVAACAQAALEVFLEPDAPSAPAKAIDPHALASLLLHVPLDNAAASTVHAACDVAELLLARGRADRARALAQHAMRVAPKRAGFIAAGAAVLLGAYRDAIEFAKTASEAGADPIEVQLFIARASQRAGNLDAAETQLAALYRDHPSHPDVAGIYARLLVTRSRYAAARQVAASAGPVVGLAAEAWGLAAFYLGDLDEAERLFAALEVTATTAGEDAALGRALSLRGMVAQQRGQLAIASDRYRDAMRRLRDSGELHAAAVAELNLGTVLSERGRAGEALPRLVAAGQVFATLGAATEQVAATMNRGNALLALGQVTEACAAAETALAGAHGAPHLRAFALLIIGDAKRRAGDNVGGEHAYREALRIAIDRCDIPAQLSARIALSEIGCPNDCDVDALCSSDDDRDRWTLARGRCALVRGGSATSQTSRAEITPTEWRTHAFACAEIAARARSADRLERAFRGHSIAARLAHQGGDPAMARNEAGLARAAHDAIAAAAAPAFQVALKQDPDLLDLPLPPEVAVAAIADRSSVYLRRLLTLSRRLNSESNVDRILDEVIDTAIEIGAAERGFLLLRSDNGPLHPVVSRNFALADLEAPERSLSRSIAEHAAQTGEPVITVDAGIDDRFAAATSVAALRLRSVMAVPLRQRTAVIGCIYVDHRLRSGAFDDSAAALLAELADIAAIAIENARLNDALRKTTASVDDLNRRLAADLAERDAELVRVKAALPDRDRLRHRYDRIVGRSPAVMRMLDMVDRAATTALPVVVVGESGTGKELVARALHDASPRRSGPFVAVNCGAVTETLLESELFGHVRGAFTGADRDRRGLFEIAHNGTLFLDEIADTGAAMQAKLLRVLQDGVIRRVGDTNTRKVDVRIIAATQRPLSELVTAATFREDLRFRIEVISIVVPPLRDRDGDIPLLVDALLGKLAANAASDGKLTTDPRSLPRLTRAALRAMSQYSWPGNVRELENVLARGVALCSGSASDVRDPTTSTVQRWIDIDDLPEGIVSAAAKPEPSRPHGNHELELRPALLATERAYIAAAMARANNNQSTAARILGLSRFGLQKKLRRLADG